MQATNQKLCHIRNALQDGYVGPFNQLQLDTLKEKVINGIPGVFKGINFRTMPLETQKTVLSAVLTGNYRSLCVVVRF